jgi:hypothetical protein
MGWGSGGNIFDLVTHGLIEAGAEDRVVDRVCTDLARALMDEDWDTEDESLDEFSDYPGGAACDPQGGPRTGSVRHSWRLRGQARVRRRQRRVLAAGRLGGTMRAAGTVYGFNTLIRVWADRGGRNAVQYLLKPPGA